MERLCLNYRMISALVLCVPLSLLPLKASAKCMSIPVSVINMSNQAVSIQSEAGTHSIHAKSSIQEMAKPLSFYDQSCKRFKVTVGEQTIQTVLQPGATRADLRVNANGSVSCGANAFASCNAVEKMKWDGIGSLIRT